MKKLSNKEEIEILEVAIEIIKDGWVADCETLDIDDFPELKDKPNSRCASCEAKEVIDFLKKTIEYAKEDAKI